ncbi:helix-turn-helix transcriptional regulator [[Clostridium] innocuum]|nr:helix-turn-helix transcriptional regulator [[Clostridium] innocuum]MCR0259155.1 helix-turn-helix transcriptional regulator [[Clostridium] innocuum]
MTVKIHLSELLGKRKMTQAELARKTGIRPNTINEMYWELIERVNLNHIETICKELNCSIGELLEIVEKNE